MMRGQRPLAEITTEALQILCREIGVVDTLRFVRQYTTGYGITPPSENNCLQGQP
jgi:hypothetical protein